MQAATDDQPETLTGAAGPGGPARHIEHLIQTRYSQEPEFQRHKHRLHDTGGDLTDFLFALPGDPHTPLDVFDKLRWGGQFVYLARDPQEVALTAERFAQAGTYEIVVPPTAVRRRLLGFIPWGTRYHYFAARKMTLIRPGESSERFTYHVQLAAPRQAGLSGSGLLVMKQVPTLERVLARLREKFPDADQETLSRRARKFTDKIFPVFLTREAAILKVLQRDLPRKCAQRIPHVIHAERDNQGFVRTLYMNWLRSGVPKTGPLTQLQFAQQATELLTALHDIAKVIHLDLRLDNFVITEKGVGFVDFGSAVRVGEEFGESTLLSSLFEEMMRTSQIQKMLGRMQEKGLVTSQEIRNSYQRIDKAVDFFYLAVQINSPHHNPDFRGLVKFDPMSAEAKAIGQLTERILRPADPQKPEFKSAQDILEGLREIEAQLKRR